MKNHWLLHLVWIICVVVIIATDYWYARHFIIHNAKPWQCRMIIIVANRSNGWFRCNNEKFSFSVSYNNINGEHQYDYEQKNTKHNADNCPYFATVHGSGLWFRCRCVCARCWRWRRIARLWWGSCRWWHWIACAFRRIYSRIQYIKVFDGQSTVLIRISTNFDLRNIVEFYKD